MDKMADVLGRAGAWCGQNKYLSAIKNAFQNFMPLTIAGAVGVLWCNVLVNADTGLGIFFEPIMALDFLNPAFNAINFATIGCITVGVTFGIAQEIGVWNQGDQAGYFPGILGIAAWISVSQTSFSTVVADLDVLNKAGDAVGTVGDLLAKGTSVNDVTFGGLSSSALGATGLFTGMIIGILSVEIYCALCKVEGLKIKMPETVPPGVARAFEVLVPACITLIITSIIGIASVNFTGLYLNDVIQACMSPLVAVGASLPGVIVIYILIMLFWLVGIHGNNMLSAVKETLFTPLALENMAAYDKGETPKHIFTMQWLQMVAEFGGSGVTIGLVIAILIFSKREDNRAVATLSLVPALFNINETVTFGIPMVLNPILGIPFILAPIACIVVAYILALIGFCPKTVLIAPWTTPPILFGFLATGANIMGAVTQAILIVISTLVYLPFLIAYEKQQNKEAAQG